MEHFTLEEFVDIHLTFGEARKNGREAQRIYRERFPLRRLPQHNTFLRVHNRLLETGSFKPQNMGNNNRLRRTPAFEEEVLNRVEEDPTASSRTVARDMGCDHMAVWRVLHEQHLYPYHLQRVQELLPGDYGFRIDYCRWLLERNDIQPEFHKRILFSDEATFSREGVFNNRNSHVWAEENPHARRIRGYQQRYSINVWVGIVDQHVIGPFLFPERLNGEIYQHFLTNHLVDLLDDVPLNIRQQMWYQHDGAPCHFSQQVRTTLSFMFPNKWIGRGGPVNWPARSPDLNPLDFYFWGHMKSLVYSTPVESDEDLVARVVAAAHEIKDKPELLEKVAINNLKRCRMCLQQNGGHFEHLM